MNNLVDTTDVIIEGTDDYPVWITFTKLDVNTYNNAATQEIDFRMEALLVVNDGSVSVAWDHKLITVGAGQGALIKKGVAAKVLLGARESASFYSLLFDEKYIVPEGLLFEKYAKKFMENDDIKVVEINDRDLKAEAILNDANRIIATNLAHKMGSELVTKGVLCHAWLSILDYTMGDSLGNDDSLMDSKDERRVRAACKYISDNYSDIVTLEDIAMHINISKGECCRAFERVIFMSPIEYLMKYRIYNAVKILLEKPSSVDSIAELSFITGFNSPSYFNRVFKKHVMCSPNEYKKMIKSDAERAEIIYTSLREEISIL